MNQIIALRYAHAWVNALAKMTDADNLLGQARQDALLLQQTLQHTELANTLQSPVVRIEIKNNIIYQIFKDKVAPSTLALLTLVLYKRRGGYLQQILEAFLSLYREKFGITLVKVTSAVSLSAENKEKIVNQLKKKYKKMEVVYHQEPKMIGGWVIEVADDQFNYSVKEQLEKMRVAFTKIN